MVDIGLTHVALPVEDAERSIAFYSTYARMEVVHRRTDEDDGRTVVWISDRTRPFVIVLMEEVDVRPLLTPSAHLGVGCSSRDEVEELCAKARDEGILIHGPVDSGYPAGYWAFIRDPDGHTLEIAHGQDVGVVVADPDARRG